LITKELMDVIQEQYRLPWEGIHGIRHWARVRENGLRIAAHLPDVNTTVVELFAVFHDAGRANDNRDDGHGRRGAELAKKLRGSVFELADDEFALLYTACCRHTDGGTEADITVQACWDADRLDLGRVGKVLNPKCLCTTAAKDPALMAWADERARRETCVSIYAEQ
jgi:uncharacterized protein